MPHNVNSVVNAIIKDVSFVDLIFFFVILILEFPYLYFTIVPYWQQLSTGQGPITPGDG
jgi:hypothetical protein